MQDVEKHLTANVLLELLEVGPAVIYMAEASAPYGAIFISENVKGQLGYGPEDFLDDPEFWVSRIHPDDVSRVLEGLPSLFEKGHRSHEYRFLHNDGRYRWMHDVLKLVRDSDGNPERIVGYWADITERKTAEEKLRKAHETLEHRVEKRTRELHKSEESMRGALESLQEGFVLFDAEDRLVMINDVFRGIQPKAQEYLEKGMRFEDLVHASVERGWVLEAIGREEAFIKDRLERHRNPTGPMVSQFGDGRWYILMETRTPDGGTALTFTEITELKQAEEARLEVETQFRSVVDTAPMGITLKDRNGKFLVSNRTLDAWTKTAPLKITDKTLYDLFPKGNIDEIIERDRRVMETGEESVAEVTRTFADGIIVHDYDTADGNIFHIRTDITEQKRAEEALRESEERFRNISEMASDRFWKMDENFRFTENIDPKGIKYPIGPQRFIGCTRWEAAGGDPEREEKWRRHLEEHLAHRPYRGFEFTVTGDDGELLHLSVSGSPIFNDTGNFKGYYGCSLNITEQKSAELALRESEVKFRGAIQNLQEGFALFDCDDRLVIWNDQYKEMLALEDKSVKAGALFEDLVRENVKFERVLESVGRGEEFIRKRLEWHQNPSGLFELTLNNGKSILASEAKTPDGGTYITLVDITKLKQTEREARDHEAELANIRRLNTLGEMAAAVAHELNQPLTVISSYAQGVAEKLHAGAVSRDDLLEPVENLVIQANRAGEIIRSLRSLIGRQEPNKVLVDINAAIEEALVTLRPECEELRIGVTLDLDDRLPQALADKIQIQQLVLNLVRNAVEAMSESPSALSDVTIRSFRNGGDSIEFEIKDTGPGFTPKEHEAVFQPFFTTKAQGLGLGLSICRSITEAHGGRIWVDPATGTGAGVHFSLPIAYESLLEDA